MSTIISGSPNVAVLDSNILVNLCNGKFYIDAIPTVYIGSGASSILGMKIRITNPYGVVIKDYSGSYEIAPSIVPDGVNTVIQYNVPLQSSNYQYGKYIIDVKLIDSDSNEYVVSKTVNVPCIPSTKTKKYGSLGASLKGSCKNGKVTVLIDTPPIYNGKLFTSQVAAYILEYPTGSGIANLSTTATSFSVVLYEGVYKITGETCVLYTFDDNVTVKVKYKVATQRDILCGLDECIVFPRLVALNEELRTDCTEQEKQKTTEIILEALNLFKLIQLGTDCGEDVSDYVSELLTLLNISDSDRNLVVKNNNPSTDFLIEGCNVTKVTVGLTDTYTIDNYEYTVDVADNGGAVVVSTATINGCTKTQTITFNIVAVYNQIKNIVNSSSLEQTFWTNILNKGLTVGGIDWTILGLTSSQVANMTLAQLMNYLLNYVKACCECTAAITSHSVSNTGSDVTIIWAGTDLFAIELYIDSVLAATVLGAATSYTLYGLADSDAHTYTLIPKSSNGKSCVPVAGTFTYFGCAAINPPSVSTNNANGVACPYDLTQLIGALPLGVTAEWHTANNTLASSLVGDATTVASGVYFAFAKDSNGCFSTGVAVTVTCAVPLSCTAPQSLMVIPTLSGFVVSFQSAANPPSTYLVKRRLEADPDVAGSYTTIGVPSWNATTNRWEILDTTAVNNTLYTYRAISQCANATTPYIDYNFANLICPALTITNHPTSIDYSFTHAGGLVDKYEVRLFDSTGTIQNQFNQFVPAFSIPIVGTFTALPSNTQYKIQVKMFVGTYAKVCDFAIAATEPVDVCPVVSAIGGDGFGGTP